MKRTEPSTVIITYIVATAERVWEALTSPEFTRQYFFGRAVELEQRAGGVFRLTMDDGRVDSQGKVLECDPPRFLSVTWHVEWVEEFRRLPEAIVTFRIEPFGSLVRLTVSEFHDESLDPKYLEGGRQGWPLILSGLKTLLETGKPLPAFEMPEPDSSGTSAKT
jgi:uncharacterized protein YndB with AHSA1/START domain